jgi:hypothetical protein
MTRLEAAAFVEALDEYLSARSSLVAVCDGPADPRILRFNACRERLLDRLCRDEATQPLAGSAK